MWTIVKLTCREIFYRRVFHFALILTSLFLFLYGTALHFFYLDPISDPIIRKVISGQMFSIGLYLGNQIIVLFAVMSSAGAISTEIDSGVIQSVLVKPLKRWEYFMGKYVGLVLVFIVYSSLFFLAVIGLNLFFGQGALDIYGLSVIKALLYYLSLPLILLGLSLWGSTHLSALVNGVIVVMLYSFATVGGILELIGTMIERQTLVNIGIISSLILPVDALYRKMLGILFTASPGDLTLFTDSFFLGKYEPSIWMLLYSLLYLLFFLWQGVRVFSKRDI